MDRPPMPLPLRAVGLLLGLGGVARLLWLLTRAPLMAAVGAWQAEGRRGVAAMGFEAALAAALAVLVLVAAGWLLGTATLATTMALARHRGGPVTAATCGATDPNGQVGSAGPVPALATLAGLSERGCPGPVRRWVVLALGLSAGALVASPAGASADPAPPAAPRASLSGLAVPDRVANPTSRATPAVVVVRAGDSLWSITERLLMGTPCDSAVSRSWRELYRENRGDIGADPDLIHPGTRLHVPPLVVPAQRRKARR